MVASDGLRGTLRQPANPLEGWRTVTNRRNEGNSESVKSKISKLVENALREMHQGRNSVAEVAPHTVAEEVPIRSQTTGNSKENKSGSEPKKDKKKRWRRKRSSWIPIMKLPNQEERNLLNKNVNTMTGWDFQCALNEYKRNQEKLVEITEGLKDTFVSLKRQGDRAECYLKMQEKINKRLFKDELKRLPKHFHNAAATVYTNHSTREALFHVRNKDHYKNGGQPILKTKIMIVQCLRSLIIQTSAGATVFNRYTQ